MGACLLLIAMLTLTNDTGSQSNKPIIYDTVSRTDAASYNQETFKEAFLANCKITAKTNLSEAAADKYCGCVLDGGIAQYGIERFIEVNQKAIEAYDFSELKDLINKCATEATT